MAKRKTVSVTPESDDFAARYDRMLETGPGPWVLRIVLATALILAVAGLLNYLLTS